MTGKMQQPKWCAQNAAPKMQGPGPGFPGPGLLPERCDGELDATQQLLRSDYCVGDGRDEERNGLAEPMPVVEAGAL
jgi:hypothetical protein